MSVALEPKYIAKLAERMWQNTWQDQNTYAFDPCLPRERNYVIDTPPPTVSGNLHMGHVFSYTQTDIIARFWRSQGKNVFYPMGFDNNGLPTERRVQNRFGIQCDPAVPDRPNWTPEVKSPSGKQKSRPVFDKVSRNDFLRACATQTAQDEKQYKALWQAMGLSIDWSQQYTTVGPHCQKTSQLAFLKAHANGHVTQRVAPTLWDTGFQTAVAQAEVEDRKTQGAYHHIQCMSGGGEAIVIATTRPELLPACVAVVAHPDDTRYQHLFGQEAITPLFHARVPILPAAHADPAKGTGILMVCTFGDLHDLQFWRSQKLPLKTIIEPSGRLANVCFGEGVFQSDAPDKANTHYAALAGLYVKPARARIAAMLAEAGSSLCDGGPALLGEPEKTDQVVKFYEKGDFPLEYIATRQWFVDILSEQDTYQKLGNKLNWHPTNMQKRYDQWVAGLNQDWCISRQRYFGVPFPVWYPIDADGQVQYAKAILAKPEQLPIDPSKAVPPGYNASQRDQAGGFTADPDVMDTWATSALTPLINSHWANDPERHAKLYPADLRPQAHEIIRTWAFYTVASCWRQTQSTPWRDMAISGWVVNPDHSKMSKSKGNAVTPEQLLDTYPADALRYWAGRAKLGQDTIYDPSVFAIGQKLINKLYNVGKFVLMQCETLGEKPNQTAITAPLDLA